MCCLCCLCCLHLSLKLPALTALVHALVSSQVRDVVGTVPAARHTALVWLPLLVSKHLQSHIVPRKHAVR